MKKVNLLFIVFLLFIGVGGCGESEKKSLNTVNTSASNEKAEDKPKEKEVPSFREVKNNKPITSDDEPYDFSFHKEYSKFEDFSVSDGYTYLLMEESFEGEEDYGFPSTTRKVGKFTADNQLYSLSDISFPEQSTYFGDVEQINEASHADFYLDGHNLVRISKYKLETEGVTNSGEVIDRINLSNNGSSEAEVVYKNTESGFYKFSLVESTIGKLVLKTTVGLSSDEYSLLPLYDDQMIPSEYTILNNSYEISEDIKFVDLIHGKYYVEVDGGLLEQLDIKNGEPLYEGATDKQLYLALENANFSHEKNGRFYVTSSNEHKLFYYLIDSNMEVISQYSQDSKESQEILLPPVRDIDTDTFYNPNIEEYQRNNFIYINKTRYGTSK